MTRYFEVTRRDGAAREGRLLLDRTYQTPLILKADTTNPIIYAGSVWDRNVLTPGDADNDRLVILPDKSLPLRVSPEKAKEFSESGKQARQVWESREGPIGRIIHPAYPEFQNADLYAIGAAGQLENNPRALMDAVLNIRNNTPSDTALYAPALATPENLALLVYLGIDIIDDTLPVIRGYNGIYMMPQGEYRLSTLSILPCSCSVCSNNDPETLKEMDARTRGKWLSQHNCNRLEEEKRIAIQHIREGSLREYVEGKCRSSPWLTALLRLIDQEKNYLMQRVPVYRSRTMYVNTSESLNRVEVTRFASRVKTRYQAPDSDILLLLPCSARKPYSISDSHRLFSRAIGRTGRAVNEVIITSPLGIVPRELELVYPAAHYDTPVTGYWDLEERSWVGECLVEYLKKYRYQYIIAHVDGAYRDICRSAAETLDLEIIYTAKGSVTSNQSLDELGSTVRSIVREEEYRFRKPAEITRHMLRAAADYQFGKGAGNLLVPENAIIKAPFPKHQIFSDNTQLASLNPATGALIPTLDGARLLLGLGTYQVRIDDFLPSGTLLAPGVLDADPGIRPSDQVIVAGEKVLGVGRALMSGREMVHSTRGAAVDLRKVKEI